MEISQRVNDVIERCLANPPAERFQTFDQVRDALVDASLSPGEESFDSGVEDFMNRHRQTESPSGTINNEHSNWNIVSRTGEPCV
jgi:serine/threonine protein kinase